MDLKALALDYHAKPTPGKVEVISRKPCATQRDLSLAYTPGVAEPCLAIQADPEKAYEYTSRGNRMFGIRAATVRERYRLYLRQPLPHGRGSDQTHRFAAFSRTSNCPARSPESHGRR